LLLIAVPVYEIRQSKDKRGVAAMRVSDKDRSGLPGETAGVTSCPTCNGF